MTKKRSKAMPLYFFLNGDLHRRIHINRPGDSITTWNYPQARLITYVYSDVRRMAERAFTTQQVCDMINRGWRSVIQVVLDEEIRTPQHTYTIDEKRHKYKYMWNEENIMELHAYFASVHRGRPRKDGLITPAPMPSARELRAMIRQESILYVKQGDEFVPTWKAES